MGYGMCNGMGIMVLKKEICLYVYYMFYLFGLDRPDVWCVYLYSFTKNLEVGTNGFAPHYRNVVLQNVSFRLSFKKICDIFLTE